ncbi:helix-turn-helix domain-containing protein [Streptomyces sp. NPDC006610]|jgi:AraC-like DNA-binding protein|uniref:helix-turn-helix domain-containing protein n=1 Tax=Streptomyces sp. NPDC006610 TaxID=3154584 RepID=UPI0033AED9E1
MQHVDMPRFRQETLLGRAACEPQSRLHIVRTHDEEMEGTTSSRQFGRVRVSIVEGGPYELIGNGRMIGNGAEPFVGVCRPLVGEVQVFQDGRWSVASGSRIVCYDSSRPYRVLMPEPFRIVTLRLPHQLIGLTAKEAELLTARAWYGSQGLGALMSDLLVGLERYGEEIETAIDLLGGSVAGLAAALFAERIRAVAAEQGVDRNALMLTIQGHIRARLADPDLSPLTVARHHNVSLRYLQKLFHERGTSPARWIRSERLARCRSELDDPGLDHLSIALIGERSGFYEASHFSRLFREEYGISPREYRKNKRSVAFAG